MRSQKALDNPVSNALVTWAEERHITPTDLSRLAGFNYSHANQLLNRKATVTDVTIGRLIRAFGPRSLMPVLEAVSEEGNHEHRSSIS